MEEILVESSAEDEKPQLNAVVLDGYDPTIEQEMRKMLRGIEAANSCLVVDSFKSLTRNVEKLFRIIEFLLTRGIPLVTTNFFLYDGHVEKRVKPLRAGHASQEMKNNLSQTFGLGYGHRQALNKYLKSREKVNRA